MFHLMFGNLYKKATVDNSVSSNHSKDSANFRQSKRYSSFWLMHWDRCGRTIDAFARMQVPDLKQEVYRLKLFDGKKTVINKASRSKFYIFILLFYKAITWDYVGPSINISPSPTSPHLPCTTPRL